MSLNPNRFPSVYDELQSFYPDYYQNVKEMQAILSAIGSAADGIVEAIDVVLDNNFILTADASMIQRLESFLGIKSLSDDIEDRRKYVLSFFTGFGKISATKLKALIKIFTLEEADISFLKKDSNNNYILEITIAKRNGINPDWSYLYDLLDRYIPAHITDYRLIVYPVPISTFFSATVNIIESYSVSVPSGDFSGERYLAMPNGALLRSNNGALLYFEEQEEE